MRKQDNKSTEMGRPEKDARCKKHPTHKNLNGVCPFCLRDRLTNISGSSINKKNAGSSSTSSASSTAYSSYESDASSSVASPPERSRKRLFQLLKGKRALKSTRSFSISKEKEEEEKRKSSSDKKGAGKIWAKLVRGEGGRKNQAGDQNRLSHSKTVKEKSNSKWAFFS